jgi:hypothetical protein
MDPRPLGFHTCVQIPLGVSFWIQKIFRYWPVGFSTWECHAMPIDEAFLEQWRIHTIDDTLNTLRYLCLYPLGILIFFLVYLFSFLDLLRESCGNNAANHPGQTETFNQQTVLFCSSTYSFNQFNCPTRPY